MESFIFRFEGVVQEQRIMKVITVNARHIPVQQRSHRSGKPGHFLLIYGNTWGMMKAKTEEERYYGI